MTPFICTANTQSHVDYGIPLLARKFTDYRTSTGTYHRFIPSVPQHYDCRVHQKIEPELRSVDITIRNDQKTVYNNSHTLLPYETNPLEKNNGRARSLDEVNYIRTVQEKIFGDPPPPIASKLSEMKDSYRMNYYRPRYREEQAPSTEGKCEIEGLGRPLQPAIPPGDHGEWKYLDIYMTENKLMYPPYTKAQMDKAREPFPTIYTCSGKYKELKIPLPAPLNGNKSVYDKTVFKYQLPPRCLSRAQKNVPNMKFKTEYSGSYISQTYSDLYPYIDSNGLRFNDCLAGAGPWQNVCPPGMYCTEYCHTGTGWPVRAVVDIAKEEPLPPHDAYIKIETKA